MDTAKCLGYTILTMVICTYFLDHALAIERYEWTFSFVARSGFHLMAGFLVVFIGKKVDVLKWKHMMSLLLIVISMDHAYQLLAGTWTLVTMRPSITIHNATLVVWGAVLGNILRKHWHIPHFVTIAEKE